MEIKEAGRIYKHPKGHTKEGLTECLRILNTQPGRLSLMEQVVIADAYDRLDILNGVIEAEYRISPKRIT
uniref:Uncharacterized protein n=1 Tax=viral metagenome TaxID=1070528 RepID=A0A6M3Y401_9ZZZZ